MEKDFLKLIGDFEISYNEQNLPNYIRPVRVGVCDQLRDYLNKTPLPYRNKNFTINGEELSGYSRNICTKNGKFAAYLKEDGNDESSAGDLLSVDLPKLTMTSYRNAIASFGVSDEPRKWLPETIIFPIQKEVWSPYHKRHNHYSYEDESGYVHGVINPLLYSIKPKKSPYVIIKGDDDGGSTEGLLLWYGEEQDNALYLELNPLIMLGIDIDPCFSMNLILYRKKGGKWLMSKTFIDFAERRKCPLGGENTPLNKTELGAFFAYDIPHIKSAITDLKEDFKVCRFIKWLVNKLSQPSWDYVDIYKELETFLNDIYEKEKIFVGSSCEVMKLLFSRKAVFNKPAYTVKFDYYVPVKEELAEEEDIDLIFRNPYDWAHKDGKIPLTFGPVQISEICKRHEGLSEKLFIEGFVQKDADYCVNVLGKPMILNFKKVMDRVVSKNPTVKDLEDGNFYVTEDITPEGIDRGKLSVTTRYLVKDGNPGKGRLSLVEKFVEKGLYFYSLPKDLFNKVISVIKTEEVKKNEYLLKKEVYDKKDYVTFLEKFVWGTDDKSDIEDYNSPYSLGELGFDEDCNAPGYDVDSWALFLKLFSRDLHKFFVDKNSSEEVKDQIRKLIPCESNYEPEFDFRFVDRPLEIPSKITLSSPNDWKKIKKPDGVSIKVEFVLP